MENTFEARGLEGEREDIDQIRNRRLKFYFALAVIQEIKALTCIKSHSPIIALACIQHS